MKLSDRELVAMTYAVNMVLGRLHLEVADRSSCVLFAITAMRSMKGELEDLPNYDTTAEELRRIGEEAETAMKDLKTELFKEMSDA